MDQFFNRDAAAWAYDLVMKMDDDAVQPFVTAVTHDLLMQDLTGNARSVNGLVTSIHASLLADAERAGIRGAVEVIAKAFGDDQFSRDSHGRFATTESRVRVDRTARALPKSRERKLGVPSAKGLAAASGSYREGHKLSREERGAYQQQYMVLADKMDEMVTAGGKDMRLVLQDKSTGRRSEAHVRNLNKIEGWNPKRQDLVAVRYDRPGTATGNASFDVVSALGSAGAGRAVQGGLEGAQRGGSAFADRWTDASRDTTGTNARTYRRIQAGSELIAQVTPAGSKAHTAAKFGEFVGQYGPEAEKVVGPQMRRTAYRYRGTERKPDAELIANRNKALVAALAVSGGGSLQHSIEREMGEKNLKAAREAKRKGTEFTPLNTPGERSAAARDIVRARVAAMEPEQKMEVTSLTARSYLADRLPDNRLAEIQRKSGKIPPSEGVIVDANGDISAQAVGFADDHYLPFNLKNLKALQGGEYVRTRSMGGLTTEDIYTGLVSGARRVTVVSNSGVFTMTFADDFRGARRYNDKAAQMVDRYAKTLDAIKSETIARDQLDPAIQAELLEEVQNEMGGWANNAEVQAEFRRRVDDYKQNPQLTRLELERIESQAQAESRGDPRDYRRLKFTMTNSAMETKRDRFYRLDGEGYSAALEALREQYPYYLQNVTYMHRFGSLNNAGERTDESNEVLTRFRAGSDQGYVAPRYNRPEAVLEGYFDPRVAGEGSLRGTGKTPAAHTNYQNWEQNPVRSRRGREPESAEETAPDAPKAQAKEAPPSFQQRMAASAERVARQGRATEAAKDAYDAVLASNVDLSDDAARQQAPILSAVTRGERTFEDAFETRRDDVIEEFGRLAANPALAGSANRIRTALERYRNTSGAAGGETYEAAQHLGVRSSQPYAFQGSAYADGADPAAVNSVRAQLTSKLAGFGMDVKEGTPDETLARGAASLGQAAKIARAGGDSDDLMDALIKVQIDMGYNEGWSTPRARAYEAALTSGNTQMMENIGTALAAHSENLERLRALGKPKAAAPATRAPEQTAAPKQQTMSSAVGYDIEGEPDEAKAAIEYEAKMWATTASGVRNHMNAGINGQASSSEMASLSSTESKALANKATFELMAGAVARRDFSTAYDLADDMYADSADQPALRASLIQIFGEDRF